MTFEDMVGPPYSPDDEKFIDELSRSKNEMYSVYEKFVQLAQAALNTSADEKARVEAMTMEIYLEMVSCLQKMEAFLEYEREIRMRIY